jgi:hypothetical protein
LFQALGVETQPAAIAAFMDYLLKSGADVSVLAMTLSRVLLHRPFIAQQILNDQSILVLSFKIFFGALGTQKNASQTLPTQNGTESEEYEDEVEEMDSSSFPTGPSSTLVSASTPSSAAPTPAVSFSPTFVSIEKATPNQLAIIDGAIELLSFLPTQNSSVSVNSLRSGLIDQLFVQNKYSLSEKQALGLIKTKVSEEGF